LGQWYVCWLLRVSNSLLVWVGNGWLTGHIMRHGVISSCQSAATFEIVKHFWSQVTTTRYSKYRTFTITQHSDSVDVCHCRRDGSLTTLQCIQRVYQQDGIRGFYRGLTASYYGIIETAIHFVIYERLRAKLVELRARRRPRDGETSPAGRVQDFLEYMAAAGTSKGIATCVGYPHGQSTSLPALYDLYITTGCSRKNCTKFAVLLLLNCLS